MQTHPTAPLNEFREILNQTMELANSWHERITRGYIPTSSEGAAFRDEITTLQLRAQAAWHRHCEADRGYQLPDR